MRLRKASSFSEAFIVPTTSIVSAGSSKGGSLLITDGVSTVAALKDPPRRSETKERVRSVCRAKTERVFVIDEEELVEVEKHKEKVGNVNKAAQRLEETILPNQRLLDNN